MLEYYTTKEVADMFRVSMQAIRNMIDRHEIKAVRIGRSYRIPVSEIERITTPKEFADDAQDDQTVIEPMPIREDAGQSAEASRAAPLPDSWKKRKE